MSTQLLSALYLASPALPIGGFAYSQGLESAIELGWVKDEPTLQGWLQGVLHEGLGQLDLPILWRCLAAVENNDRAAQHYWNDLTFANRETHELVFEEEQLGAALRKLLLSLNKIDAASLPEQPSYLLMFAVASGVMHLSAENALAAFCWSWLENQVTVACKTIPLGQTAAQRVLLHLMPEIELVTAKAKMTKDDDIGATLPGLIMASALHETQYSRLFRS
ncbi:MAG: urease accessory protein UreF [Hahellaceae bacterium]|nr:urease accessory protein UreF [Hahellaceae bacterium]MCP5209793.1 urease accessory protein UreF [Hahellaceae bacterium]